ncbi:MAG: Acyl-CoA thioesterase [uncultured Sulfurovum sp.]|uniref:Acyl-CoA thioesterase n=1 Tax=uncultured Sulfurovum sp. TaxID=269237 RepID=A0A6S6T0L2_9BACT|nr:MAG: Acyl-CoA thioesterase [uncultured Sulfurovum sp.]
MRQLSLKGRTFPTDLNHAGTVFGGWVMSKMDKAASIQLEEIIKSPAVTVAVSNLSFISPIHNGDVFMIYTKIDKIGNTSIDICVELIVRRKEDLTEYKVTQGIFKFVAVNDEGVPVTVASVLREQVPKYVKELSLK